MATFTDIVSKQREKGEGIGSSLATAFSERAKERLDPRNYLFKKKGLLTALLPGLKGYQAGGEKLKGEKSEGLGEGVDAIVDRLGELKQQLRMIAKSSLVLPQMARDTSITKQNIKKLVRAQGDTPENNSEKAFFFNAAKRESIYENNMKAGKPTPNKKGEEKENKSLFRKILEFIIGTVGFLFKSLISIIPDLVGGLKKLSSVIGTILSIASNFGLLKMAGRVLPSLGKGLLLAGAGAAAVGVAKGLTSARPPSPMTMEEKGKYRANRSAGMTAEEAKKQSQGFKSMSRSADAIAAKAASKTATEGVKKGLWGRFLAYVEKKSPQLFARIGKKLAVAAALMAIPLVGWVMAAIDIGFTLWTAYELYQLWKEFTNEEDSETLPNNPPVLDKSKYDDPPKPVEVIPPNATAPAPAAAPAPAGRKPSLNPMIEAGRKASEKKGTVGRGNSNMSFSAVTPGNQASTNSLAEKMKKGDTSAYAHQPGTDILAQRIASSVPEFAQFTGFNDQFHQQNHPRSKHAKGLAIDFVTKGGAKTQDAAVTKIKKMMTDAGLESGDYLVQSEILGKTPHATGDHVHVEFKDELVAEKFRTHATNAALVPSAYAASSGQTPTQAAAAPAALPAGQVAAATPAAVSPKSVKLAAASQTHMDLTRQSNGGSGSPVINNVVNNNGGGGGGTTIIAGASLYDKDLVDLFMDSLGTA
jgi:hypothetical protein